MQWQHQAMECSGIRRWFLILLLGVGSTASLNRAALAIDGGTLRINAVNGWMAFEVITVGDNPAGDGYAWAMPGTFDGLGAWLNGETLRLQVNHENSDATISEVDLNLANFKTAIGNVIDAGNTGGVSFVTTRNSPTDGGAATAVPTGPLLPIRPVPASAAFVPGSSIRRTLLAAAGASWTLST